MGIQLDAKEKSLLKQFYESKNDTFKYTREGLFEEESLIGAMELARNGLIDAITGEEVLKEGIINPPQVKANQTYYFISKKGLEYHERAERIKQLLKKDFSDWNK